MKFTIWSNKDLCLDDWRDDLAEEYPDADEDELYQLMCETNDDYLDDERLNLSIPLRSPVLCIADMGLWHGRCTGFREIKTGFVGDLLSLFPNEDCAYCEWGIDARGDLALEYAHHDGTNRVIFRQVKPYVSRYQLDNLERKIASQCATRNEITKLTSSLGPEVKAVYGW